MTDPRQSTDPAVAFDRPAEQGVGAIDEFEAIAALPGIAPLLADWDAALPRFTEVMPSDYKRVLEARAEALEEGLDEDEAAARIMEVLHG